MKAFHEPFLFLYFNLSDGTKLMETSFVRDPVTFSLLAHLSPHNLSLEPNFVISTLWDLFMKYFPSFVR